MMSPLSAEIVFSVETFSKEHYIRAQCGGRRGRSTIISPAPPIRGPDVVHVSHVSQAVTPQVGNSGGKIVEQQQTTEGKRHVTVPVCANTVWHQLLSINQKDPPEVGLLRTDHQGVSPPPCTNVMEWITHVSKTGLHHLCVNHAITLSALIFSSRSPVSSLGVLGGEAGERPARSQKARDDLE